MDPTKVLQILNELVKEYEKTETYCILFYSSNHTRDFALLKSKVELYKQRINAALSDGYLHDSKTRTDPTKEIIQ